MAVNRDSNGYTFVFAIALVVVVGTILASLSLGLGPIKEINAKKKKQMDLLSAIGVESTRKNATDKFEEYIPSAESFVINAQGEKVEGQTAFDIDVKKQYRDKKIKKSERLYPVFKAKNINGEEVTICPVVGAGLWGPVWGYVAIGADNKTISGISLDHKTETPGLGAEIKQSFFEDRWKNAQITQEIKVMKDGSGSKEIQKVDGITGGTITSKGVEEMMNRTMAVYNKYFNKANS